MLKNNHDDCIFFRRWNSTLIRPIWVDSRARHGSESSDIERWFVRWLSMRIFTVNCLLRVASSIFETLTLAFFVMIFAAATPMIEAFYSSLPTLSRRFALSVPFAAIPLITSKKYDYAPFDEGHVKVARGEHRHSLYYRLYNPNSELTPLVVLHGGP